MTPAETLQAAADRLTAMDKAATTAQDGWAYYDVPGGRAEMCAGPMDTGYRLGVVCTWEEEDDGHRLSQGDANLIVALRPLAPLLAEILTYMAGTAAKDPRLFEETTSGKRWLAVARTVLGGAE